MINVLAGSALYYILRNQGYRRFSEDRGAPWTDERENITYFESGGRIDSFWSQSRNQTTRETYELRRKLRDIQPKGVSRNLSRKITFPDSDSDEDDPRMR